MGPKTKKILARFFKFFIIGIVMGITEDLIAIHFATDAKITWHVFKIAFIVAFPFAIISEIVADAEIFKKIINKKSSSDSKIAKKC